MKITDNLMVDSKIPFKKVINLQFLWCLDEHADLKLEGILDAEQAEKSIRRDYRSTEITIEYENGIVFRGIIKETKIKAKGGLYEIMVKAVSATDSLDIDAQDEMFQNVSLTYKKMLQQMVSKKSGQIICTIGDEPIKTPLLCYKETIWQYAKRMASHFHSHVIADIKTGKPSFWFGLRKGKSIENHALLCKQIEIRKSIQKRQKERTSYLLIGGQDYQLCDRLFVDGGWQTIYEKRACMERGELIYTYLAAREDSLNNKEIYYQKNVTGLSLRGTVEITEKEQVYIRLEIDGKPGEYPFSWLPETGTGLYAMPETGAKVELYFMGADEREAIAIRCRDTGETDCDEKWLKLPDGTKLSMNASKIGIEKNCRMDLTDRNIAISGDKMIEISAAGKVKVTAKIIEVNAEDTINYVTEW